MFSSKMKHTLALVAAATLVSACTTVKEVEVIRTVEVVKPVAVPCITAAQLASRGTVTLSVNDESIAAAPDVDTLARMYRSDHLLMEQRAIGDEALIKMCSTLPDVAVGTVIGQ